VRRVEIVDIYARAGKSMFFFFLSFSRRRDAKVEVNALMGNSDKIKNTLLSFIRPPAGDDVIDIAQSRAHFSEENTYARLK